jgi:hypothetical protein
MNQFLVPMRALKIAGAAFLVGLLAACGGAPADGESDETSGDVRSTSEAIRMGANCDIKDSATLYYKGRTRIQAGDQIEYASPSETPAEFDRNGHHERYPLSRPDTCIFHGQYRMPLHGNRWFARVDCTEDERGEYLLVNGYIAPSAIQCW